MPYIFSHQQIDRCHHLLTEHNYDVNQIADVMSTSIRDATHLIRLTWQKYPNPKKKVSFKEVKKAEPVAFVRPKAEYSNKRIYDLV